MNRPYFNAGMCPHCTGRHGFIPLTYRYGYFRPATNRQVFVPKWVPTMANPSSSGPNCVVFKFSNTASAPPTASNIPPYPNSGQPISNQPSMSQNTFGGTGNVPSGFLKKTLEDFAHINQLLVRKETVPLNERRVTKTKFTIENALGQFLFCAGEPSFYINSNGGDAKVPMPFHMMVFNCYTKMLINLERRPYIKSSCSSDIQRTEVLSQGLLLGTIEQWSFYPKFVIKNENGKMIFRIEGSFSTMPTGDDIKFRIISVITGEEIGRIDKKLFQEIHTCSGGFDLTFPMNLDVRIKAVLLGACLLFGVMYCE